MAKKVKVKAIQDFREAFKNKRIPILTIDNRWHELFPDYDKPAHIKALEDKINRLLQSQGKMVNDIKDMRKLKKKLMTEIIANMDTDSSEEGKLNARKLEKSSELIREINDKLKQNDDELEKVPYQIKALNEELMVQSMMICYERMHRNQSDIQKLASWIITAREELKERILLKQDKEAQNSAIYAYMHDLLGPEVLDVFDKNL